MNELFFFAFITRWAAHKPIRFQCKLISHFKDGELNHRSVYARKTVFECESFVQ